MLFLEINVDNRIVGYRRGPYEISDIKPSEVLVDEAVEYSAVENAIINLETKEITYDEEYVNSRNSRIVHQKVSIQQIIIGVHQALNLVASGNGYHDINLAALKDTNLAAWRDLVWEHIELIIASYDAISDSETLEVILQGLPVYQ